MDTKKRYTELSARLREGADRYPESLRRLGQALWDEQNDPQAHETCLAALPEYVESELAGKEAAGRFPEVKQHLDTCESCALVYAELLDSESAFARGALTQDALPAPDLSFLSKTGRDLPQVVLEWTRDLVRRLAPSELDRLELVAPPLFAQWTLHAAHETRSAYDADARGETGGVDYASTLLEASFATTRALIAETSRGEFDTWVSENELKPQVTAVASAAARTLRLERGLAERFATAFADTVAAEPAPLRALLK